MENAKREMNASLANAICYNLCIPQERSKFSYDEVMDAIRFMTTIPFKLTNRTSLYNALEFLLAEYDRKSRQIDILMGHDIVEEKRDA